ncbi:hypothetical protein OGH69_16905 [Flavobacterium sp. MFBS3-15]|uniref:hypothetical protein n=1 Tax=Flavobacterium sp. MFBS3-15 TaxID=2989816 RepID=UPI002235C530|nr:hypothetical protein [Flavobacterium sp. MFBS3-15]MCW4470654.1 hypothetical protein [Flavobacterium sp. MFBS3-15]
MMRLSRNIVFIGLFATTLSISCKKESDQPENPASSKALTMRDSIESGPKETTVLPDDFHEMYNNLSTDGIGVIVAEESFGLGDKVIILDNEQKPVTTIVLEDEKQILRLQCLDEDSQYYTVNWKNSPALVAKEPGKIKLETWNEHILNICCIDFDEKTNPLREFPDDDSKTIAKEKDELYMPVEVKGEWLRVSWGHQENEKSAWIKWRNEKGIILELFYFA